MNMPVLFPVCPPLGPAIIKGQLSKHGYSCEVWDLNIELFQIEKFRSLFTTEYELLVFKPPQSSSRFIDYYEKQGLREVFQAWADNVIKANPKTLGLSLYSFHSGHFGERLIFEVRDRGYRGRIVLGGPFAHDLHRKPHLREFYPQDVDVIAGEGELAILSYLKGDLNYPGINSAPVPLNDLNAMPIPEYEDGQFEPFDRIEEEEGLNKVYITASRGCVRRCTFCDIKNMWPKYRYRSAEHIFREIVYLHEKFNRTEFKFTDSLINGNLKMLSELSELIVDYKARKQKKRWIFFGKKSDPPRIHWGGHFICRTRASTPPEFFSLIARAGCCYVSIGVESGSERVRKHMGKPFSNEDLFYTLEQFNRVGISVTFLMVIGYLTETEEDFQQTLQLFKDCKDRGLLASPEKWACVQGIELGPTLTLPPDTEVRHLVEKEIGETPSNSHWTYNGLDRFTRLERLFRAMVFIEEMGYSHLLKGQLGSRYGHLWNEFINFENFQRVDRDVIEVLANAGYFKNA